MSWRKVKLGEICKIEKGLTGIQKAIPGDYPLVVTGEERKTHSEYQFEDEAVIIPLVSGTGHGHASIKRIHYQTGKFALGNILCAVIPKDKKQLSAEYLYRFLELNKDKELVSRMKGMANVTLPIKEIAAIEIPLPSIAEQIQFVERYNGILGHTSKLSSQFTDQISILRQLRQSFLSEAMQGKLVEQDPTDEPASELLKKIKAEKEKLVAEKKLKKEKELPPIKTDEIPFDIPQNWVWCRFYRVAIIESNLVSPKDFPDHLHIAPDNIEKNTGHLLFCKTVKEDNVQSANHHFYPGQLIYSKVRPKLNKVVNVNFEGLCSADMYPLLPLIKAEYLLFAMLSKHFLNEVEKYDNRVKMPKINQIQLAQIPIPLPPLPEQHRIVAKLEELMGLCDALEISVKESKEQNDRLLQEVLREALGGDK